LFYFRGGFLRRANVLITASKHGDGRRAAERSFLRRRLERAGERAAVDLLSLLAPGWTRPLHFGRRVATWGPLPVPLRAFHLTFHSPSLSLVAARPSHSHPTCLQLSLLVTPPVKGRLRLAVKTNKAWGVSIDSKAIIALRV